MFYPVSVNGAEEFFSKREAPLNAGAPLTKRATDLTHKRLPDAFAVYAQLSIDANWSISFCISLSAVASFFA